jgi:predicted O-methyltransferase YrrM
MARLLERCPILKEMMESQSAHTQSGEQIPIHSNIPPAYAEALYEIVLQGGPAVVLEVGMAFGVSSLAILSALRDGNREGRLISIDPVQSSDWKGCGLAAIARARLGERHELIEDYDYNALPRLLAAGLRIDFAYIDGWHTFDYALVDWWYVDKMLTVDGIVGFNDCSWRAVDKVIRFVLSHRKYTEIDVGLPVTLAGYSRKRELLRRLTFGRKEQWYRRHEDRYLKKTANWEPRWDFFAPF